MPYVPKFRHLFKILFRIQDGRAAEGLWLEGTWLHEQGDDEGALMAFNHARLLDRKFGGAYYNYAALTEKHQGKSPQAMKAWRDYLAMAEEDSRQPRETIDKIRRHLEDLQREKE
ncbi:MAG: hypothetical protein JJU11_13525 [Candidatus Sumerlaeia bacterium]|nr:hypothetical protein [Candidatus Sumerlaeia bacterium]